MSAVLDSVRPSAALWLAPLLVATWLVAAFWADSYDDAFITYRYAQNLATRGELIFNPGERVLGTTAPGFAVALALLSAASRVSVAGWGTLVSALSILAAAMFLERLLRPYLAASARLAGVVFAGAALLGRWNIELWGSEFMVLLALGLACATTLLVLERPAVAGAIATCAAFVRLDAALLMVVLAAASWAVRRRPPLVFALVGTVPLLGWMAWLQSRFGTIVPQTLAAKRAESAFARFSHFAAEVAWFPRTFGWLGLLALLGLATWGMAVLGTRLRRPRLREAHALFAIGVWVGLHELAYGLIGVPFAPWYHLYLVNALFALAAIAVGAQWLAREARWPRTLIAAGMLLAPGAAYCASRQGTPPDPRQPIYTALAKTIAANAPRGATSLAAHEIGVLGYVSGARVLDLMGLVSPEAMIARREHRTPAWLLDESPCWVVDASLFHDGALSRDFDAAAFRERYRLHSRVPDGRAAGLFVNLYRLRGEAC